MECFSHRGLLEWHLELKFTLEMHAQGTTASRNVYQGFAQPCIVRVRPRVKVSDMTNFMRERHGSKEPSGLWHVPMGPTRDEQCLGPMPSLELLRRLREAWAEHSEHSWRVG